MFSSFKQAGKSLGRELSHTWENLTEGWHELLSRSNDALTHFVRKNDEEEHLGNGHSITSFPRWSLIAGEVEETDKEILVRIEVPGMEKEDLQMMIDGNVLYLSGEKHIERESRDSNYHIMERAYGAFKRAIPLPRNVNADDAEASYKNGVLKIHLPKLNSGKIKNIPLA